MECFETIEYRGYEIGIWQDYDYPDDPRDWSNLGKMLCYHPDYKLGDQNIKEVVDWDLCDSWDDVKKQLIELFDPLIILPLKIYDHSGITISVDIHSYPYNDCWDSSFVGFVLVPKEDVRKEWKVKRISKKLKQKVLDNVLAEVETYDKYVRGEIYGFNIEDLDECIGGYFDYDYMIQEAKNTVDFWIKKNREEKQKKLKALIKNKVSLLKRSNLLDFAI